MRKEGGQFWREKRKRKSKLVQPGERATQGGR